MFGRRTALGIASRTAKPANFFQFPSSSSSTTSSSSYTSAYRNRDDKNYNGYVSLSSEGSTFNGGLPTNVNYGFPINNWSAASACDDEEYELVSVDEIKGAIHGVSIDHVFGPAPSVAEVQHVVSAIEKVFDSSTSSQLRDKFSGKDIVYRISSPTASESLSESGSWIEPDSRGMLQSYGPNRVYDALHLLQTDSTIQRMVFSLSSDRDVWNSIMNNEVVKELRDLYYTGEDINPFGLSESSASSTGEEESSKVTNIVAWIFNNPMDLLEKITSFLSGLFKLPAIDESPKSVGGGLFEEAGRGVFEQRLRTSFMLSIFVLLVVVVARAKIT